MGSCSVRRQKALEEMQEYCKHDVELLKRVSLNCVLVASLQDLMLVYTIKIITIDARSAVVQPLH